MLKLCQKSEFRRGLFRAMLAMFAVSILVSASAVAHGEQNKKPKPPKLTKYYANWLDRDVAYIITKAERKEFLQLASDEDRDNFIQRFWDIRNPTPGSPSNTYKDEIY